MLPKLANRWKTLPLGEMCDVIMGQAPKGDSYNEKGIGTPLIAGAADLGTITPQPKKWTSAPTKLGKRGDIILCVRATIGDLNWADAEYCYGRGVAAIRSNSRIESDFIWYWLSTCKEHLLSIGRGATFKQISKQNITSLPIPAIGLTEQRRIVARIKECMERVEEIENIRRDVAHEFESLIPAALEDIFYRNGFDEIPLFDLLREKPKNGVYLPKSNYVESGGVPIVRMGEMFRRFEVEEQVEKSVNANIKLIDDYALIEGDVLVARRSIVYEGSGSMAVVTKLNEGSIFESSIIRLRLDVKRILPPFVVAFFHSREGFYRRMSITKKATISGVNQQGLKRLTVPCPSIQDQEVSLQRVNQVRASCSEMEKLIPKAEVAALRDSILSKAFSGEL